MYIHMYITCFIYMYLLYILSPNRTCFPFQMCCTDTRTHRKGIFLV